MISIRTGAIVDTMARQYLYDLLPTTEGQRRAYAHGFWQKCGIPNIVGALDSSHIRIIVPLSDKHVPKDWIGRDGKASMTVQVRAHSTVYCILLSALHMAVRDIAGGS